MLVNYKTGCLDLRTAIKSKLSRSYFLHNSECDGVFSLSTVQPLVYRNDNLIAFARVAACGRMEPKHKYEQRLEMKSVSCSRDHCPSLTCSVRGLHSYLTSGPSRCRSVYDDLTEILFRARNGVTVPIGGTRVDKINATLRRRMRRLEISGRHAAALRRFPRWRWHRRRKRGANTRESQNQPRRSRRRRRPCRHLPGTRAFNRSTKTAFQFPLRSAAESVVGVVVRARPSGSVGVLRAEIQTKAIPQRETRDFDPEVVRCGDVAVDRVVLHDEENAAAEAFADSGD